MMHFLPIEIVYHILSFLLLDTYKHAILVNSQLCDLKPEIIAFLVKKQSPILLEIRNKLPQRLKKYLCAFCAYLGDKSNVEYLMDNCSFQENDRYKIASYAVFGGMHEQLNESFHSELNHMG